MTDRLLTASAARPPSADRRQFLQLLLRGSLAVSAVVVAGCAAGDGTETPWRGPKNWGSGNRGGDNGPRGGRSGGGGGGRGGGGGPGR